MNPITRSLQEHYQQTFIKHGPNERGVDWGAKKDIVLRYRNMLSVILPGQQSDVSLLDVGCGYGGLLEYIDHSNFAETQIQYTGIDVVSEMITYARSHQKFDSGSFAVADILSYNPADHFDYVVCNGILTQKLQTSHLEMEKYLKQIVEKMFALCRIGIAFNVMTTKVNFMAPNLFYLNPVELFAYCMNQFGGKVKVDHSYPLYEYTVYIYK
ncbi:class I SAM-dependent methyltransferase [Cohnella suwonensis]|uniref:Class I SAM-dependent methyltransferase n=1 Tax=Cohnella suwonensis TaxID=696072 RepID=A0ABW0LV16_9BACL